METRLKLFIAPLLISTLVGCAAGNKESILPQTGPKMIEVYEGQMKSSLTTKQPRMLLPTRSIESGSDELKGYTRTSETEINNQFPTLPNPKLSMYIFPHLAGPSNHPVPGYSTSFSLYEKTQYALPGEVR